MDDKLLIETYSGISYDSYTNMDSVFKSYILNRCIELHSMTLDVDDMDDTDITVNDRHEYNINFTKNVNMFMSSNDIIYIKLYVKKMIGYMISRYPVTTYQITFYNKYTNIYLNIKNIDDLDRHTYDYYLGIPLLTSITVRGTTKTYSSVNTDVISRGGEGVPINLGNGFWTSEVYATRKYCIIYSYLQWIKYINGMSITTDISKECYRESAINNLSNIEISISNVTDNYRLVYSIEGLTPQDTVHTMLIYVYSFNHISLIVHESLLTNDDIKWIIYRSKTPIIGTIHNTKLRDNTVIDYMTLDIECYRDTSDVNMISHIPIVAGLYNGSTYIYETDTNCILNILYKLSLLSGNATIFVHNGGKYDFHLMLQAASTICDLDYDRPIDISDVNGCIISMDIRTARGLLSFRDSFRLMPSSLHMLCNSFDTVHKKDISIDICNMSYSDIINNIEYNRLDCISLYEVLYKYRDVCIRLGWPDILQFRTNTSYMKHIFYSLYYDESKTPIKVLSKYMDSKIRKYYHGGRVEIFHRGIITGNINCYDINSSYPYAACDSLPYGPPLTNTLHEDARRMYNNGSLRCGFYKVIVTHDPKLYIPLHGIHDDNKGYYFPHFNTLVKIRITDRDIIYGLSLGYEYLVVKSITFSSDKYMNQYIHDIYRLKKNSTDGEKMIWKSNLNCSYGWWGFNKYSRNVLDVYHIKYIDQIDNLSSICQCDYYRLNNILVVNSTNDTLCYDTNVSIAAYITAISRINLHKLMMHIMNSGGDIYYCDTDCVYTNISIDDNKDIVGSDIGMVKRDNHVYISKLITIDNKVLIKYYVDGIYDVIFKGLKYNKYVDSDCNISDLDELGLQIRTQDMIDCFLGNKQLELMVSNIIRSRSNKTKGLMLYERITKISFIFNYISRHVDIEGNTRAYVF